ncbi:MAG: DUF4836 family protein [Microscillaceae bacterium]|jgi:hypothetical protein|nr:DUF4836 family protein [Microscillaceae bacterium]
MKNFFVQGIFYSISLALLLGLQTCGISPDNSKFIPKEASFALSLNLNTLHQKAGNPQNLLENSFFKAFVSNDALQQDFFLKNFAASGIDWQSKAYIFGDMTEKASENYVAISFKLTDESKFDNFLRNIPAQKILVKTYSGLRFAILDNKTILGWLNQVGLLISVNTKSSEEVLLQHLLKLRDLPETESLKTNEQFKKIQETPHDLATWVNLASFSTPLKQFLRKFFILNADLKDNYLTSTTNFGKGEVMTDLKFYNLNKSLAEYKDIFKKGINHKLISRVPVNVPMGALGVGLEMKGVKKLYDDIGMGSLLGSFLNIKASTGFNLPELMQMFSGDILAVLKDIKIQEDSQKPDYELVVGLGIARRDILDKVLAKMLADGTLQKDGNSYYAPQSQTYWIEKDSALYATTGIELHQQLLKPDNELANKNLVKLAERSFLMGFTDVREEIRQKLPKELFGNDRMTEGLVKFTKTPLESFAISSLPFEKDILDTRIVFGFKNHEENALKLILKMEKWF